MVKILSKPVLVASGVIFLLVLIHVGLWMGRTYHSGFFGELCGKIQGLAITPFLMELSLVAFGFLTVLTINAIRQKRDGCEFVTVAEMSKSSPQSPPNS